MVVLLSAAAIAQQPTSFPRKHLMEHFTGEACGYCPGGMQAMQTYLAQTTKSFVWVSHHAGYSADEYTIPENDTLATKLAVQGAPSLSVNRTRRRVNGSFAYAFHPGYLEDAGVVPMTDADTALANVIIDRTYDAATRQLTLTVHGLSLDVDTVVALSVLIKENGLIGHQSDYENTFEGWDAFRHNKTVRVMLSKAMGDKVSIVDGEYSKTYTYTLPGAWNADNCVAVAYITKYNAISVQAVINAEQIVVVEGTTGGEELLFEGITPTPVDATYPESGAPMSDITFSTCNVSTKYYSQYGLLILTLQSTQKKLIGGYNCTPYLELYVYSRTSSLSAGTYPITDDANWNVVYAGYRDDEEFNIGGSILYYVFNQNGSLHPMREWLLRSGSMTVYDNGAIKLSATTLNGSTFQGTYGDVPEAIVNTTDATKAVKTIENGRLVIHHNAGRFDAMGIKH